MLLKNIIAEDFTNYYKTSMFLIFPYCSFKCDKECGKKICQNGPLVKQPNIEITTDKVIKQYLDNPISHAIVCGGLEPLDSFNDLVEFIIKLRFIYKCEDDVVIYTGFNRDEVLDKINILKQFNNIIVKFGRYIPDQKPHIDPILKIYLASDNQFAEKL